jgi:hypothetical protein
MLRTGAHREWRVSDDPMVHAARAALQPAEGLVLVLSYELTP